jgi:hypothetical protein
LIQCDVLLISGHFAGSFFGDSGKTLPLRDLEKSAKQGESLEQVVRESGAGTNCGGCRCFLEKYFESVSKK